jgi:hypothetical protein
VKQFYPSKKEVKILNPSAILFRQTDNLNILTYNDYYNRLKLLALSMFEWENVPDSVSIRFLEKALYEYGQAVFINDDSMGYMALKVIPSGELNVYENPVRYTAFSVNYNKEFDADKCVLIRNNLLNIPTDYSIQLFAMRLYEAERTIDVNIKQQKTPTLIMCDEKQRLTLKNLYAKFDGNEPVIYGDKSLNPDSIKVLKTDAPFIALDMTEYKRGVWNEAMTFLGIKNANTSKRERLITDEVEANDEQISLSADSMLLTRKKACEAINKKYGLNISVKLRQPLLQEGEEVE